MNLLLRMVTMKVYNKTLFAMIGIKFKKGKEVEVKN